MIGAVYWLTESARRAVQFERTMQQVADAANDIDGGTVTPIQPGSPDPGPDVSPAPKTGWSAAFVDEYHAEAVLLGKQYECRTEGCLHTAPAKGDRCPVCADEARRVFTDRGDAA